MAIGARAALLIPGNGIPVYISTLVFTDDTIAELVDTASDARTGLLWARVYGFWLVVGLGIALMVVGALGIVRARPKGVG